MQLALHFALIILAIAAGLAMHAATNAPRKRARGFNVEN